LVRVAPSAYFRSMIVPQFWAEARRHRDRAPGCTQITVRRFGWSDVNQADAQAMAEQRAQAAFQQVVSGEKLPRREPKVAYNGAQGVPIREEVLERHGDVVITRNAYGARCLNTPDVLFADIDFNEELGCRAIVVWGVVLLVGAIAGGVWLKSGAVGVLLALLALICAYPVAALLRKIAIACRGGAERAARGKIEAYVGRHPEWNLRLYRTPAGFRLLATHAVFAPDDPSVTKFFSALGVDRVYAAMCRNQHCFRARVSPKPWRVGVMDHIRPRPGVWPVKPEHLGTRRSWIQNYEDAAARFAACRFVETFGSGPAHPKADAVRILHDRLSQALSGREIA
jgi:hypothetical protein